MVPITKQDYKVSKGSPLPLGSSKSHLGLNFALFSKRAKQLTLQLFSPGERQPFFEVELDPEAHKTGEIWHVCIEPLSQEIDYGYLILLEENAEAHFVSDPYALSLATSNKWGVFPSGGLWAPPRGRALISPPFDWEHDAPPKIPYEDLIIYEMHVRGFTNDPSSKSIHPGTFLGVIEKIPYLKSLGINAVELMPVFEFNECEYRKVNPETGKMLCNFWGYSTINFFSPMNRFASADKRESAINEFKRMVKELHKNNIEVILDVVFNHTAERKSEKIIYSFKGIDPDVYYIRDEKGKYLDFTGCGNTLNANHPITAAFILDSLRYWVKEMHVDGFRFDLASALTRDDEGTPLTDPPLIRIISEDPLLANIKLIAEAWDAAGLYQVGSFPSYGRWMEWNGKYRDTVRKFLKGTDNTAGAFATCLSGSEDLYVDGRKPYHSVNFVTCHDGFTLQDLVSYNQKHNSANQENNQDGENVNESWNCGEEGETKNRKILFLRERQRRNFLLALMVSIGTPMVLMGDEYGHTREGNNNAWCQDNELNLFQWDEVSDKNDFLRFYKLLVHFRKNHPLLKRDSFLTNEDVAWHGLKPLQADWGPHSRLVAYTLKDKINGCDLFIAFNAGFQEAKLTLPPPPAHKKWHLIIDTSYPTPNDFRESPESSCPLKYTYSLPSYSSLLLKAF